MKITKRQFEKIKRVFPKSRSSVQIDRFTMINILLYVVENGCKWRALPKEFGNWHTVYMRMCQLAENGVLFHLFEALQNELKLQVDTSALSLDSSCIKVHPDGTGALKKTENNPSAKLAAVGNAQLRIRTAVRLVMVRKSGHYFPGFCSF